MDDERLRVDDRAANSCAGCGSPLSGQNERSYVFADDAALCWRCALDRGGSYDAAGDTWTRAPNVEDLRRPWTPRE
jgi:hypothetical protein